MINISPEEEHGHERIHRNNVTQQVCFYMSGLRDNKRGRWHHRIAPQVRSYCGLVIIHDSVTSLLCVKACCLCILSFY